MSGFDEVFDYVVVGSGGGSMCAALVMRKAGKSVVILEKTAWVGGTTARSGGAMWVPNNLCMKRDGIPDSTEKAMTYLDTLIGDDPSLPGATRERQLQYVTEAPRMLEFISEQGVSLTRTDFWPDYYDNLPGGSADSRSVFAEVFDARELGPWADKLRRGFMPYPVNLGEIMRLPHFKKSWIGKRKMAKVAFRTALSKLTGAQYLTAGAALQGRMLKAALKAKVDIRPDSPVTELVEESSGSGVRITGVVTQKDGKPWRVGANLGVLVNAGGFAHNQAMRDQYIPHTRVEWTSAAEGDTGEMLQEMMRHGAAIGHMRATVGNQMTPIPGSEASPVKPGMQTVTAKPHAILVDQTGVRYLSEGGSYSAYCQAMMDRHKTVPAIPSWAIWDERLLKEYMFGGSMPGGALAKTPGWIASGYMKKADTIEDLARQLAIDPATLVGTVDRFNGFVDKGVDEDFHRGDSHYDSWLGDPYREGSASLGRIDQGPFYAVPVLPGDMGTYGGVVTDVHGRVLREDGSVIEGLYATGVSTAGVMGYSYPGGGCSVGPSFTFGYVSARHAAGLSNQA